MDIDPSAAGVTQLGEGTPIQTIQIDNPEPGNLACDVTPSDLNVNIFLRSIKAKGRLDSPIGIQNQYSKTEIQYTILDSRGEPLRDYEDPLYDLIVEAEIQAGGESWPISLNEQKVDVLGDEISSYSTQFVPTVSGEHEIIVSATSQDRAGKEISVFKGSVGTFNVGPLLVQAVDVPKSGRQFDTSSVQFELVDARGQKADNDVNATLVVSMDAPNGTSETIKIASQNGEFNRNLPLDQFGVYEINLEAKVDIEGESFPIAVDVDQFELDVSEVQSVSIQFVPDQPLSGNHTDLLFNAQPLLVQFEVVIDSTGRAVKDLDDVLVDGSDRQIQLELFQPESDNLPLGFNKTGEEGVFELSTEDLGMGEHELVLKLSGDVSNDFIMNNDQVSVVVNRLRHPLHLPIFLAAIGLIALLILIFILNRRRVRRSKLHPALGTLRIINAHGQTRFMERLDNHNRNHIVFNGKQLVETVSVTKLDVRCDNDADHENKRVTIKVHLDGEKQPRFERSLGPRGQMKLAPYELWLLKDPDPEQLEPRI